MHFIFTERNSQQIYPDVDQIPLEVTVPSVSSSCLHDESCEGCWTGYPPAVFPSWTHRQLFKSKIQRAIAEYNRALPCTLHRLDSDFHGLFTNAGPIIAEHGEEERVWQMLVSEQVCIVIFLLACLLLTCRSGEAT